MSTSTQRKPPELPALIRAPLAFLPQGPARFGIQHTLNFLFAAQLREGELDFLEGRVMSVGVTDADIEFTMTAEDRRLRVLPASPDAELRIAGSIYAFLLLATRAEDSDTLFFRRQLSTTGDTELGLYLKNFLDALDPTSMPLQAVTSRALKLGLQSADAIDRLRQRITGWN